MAISKRMLIGAIASNPARYDGPGEYRYSIKNKEIYYTSAERADPKDADPWFALPALNPDGSKRMEKAFQKFISLRWRPSRQAELDKFASRKGWDLAMELRYGGGALEDEEANEWQFVVNRELDRLAESVLKQIEEIEAKEKSV